MSPYGDGLSIADSGGECLHPELQKGLRLARGVGFIPTVLTHLAVLGSIHQVLGETGMAWVCHAKAMAASQSLPEPFRAMIAAELCADAVAAGAWDQTYVWAAEAPDLRYLVLAPSGFTYWNQIAALLHGGARHRSAAPI